MIFTWQCLSMELHVLRDLQPEIIPKKQNYHSTIKSEPKSINKSLKYWKGLVLFSLQYFVGKA